jgi:hypothetical protein
MGQPGPLVRTLAASQALTPAGSVTKGPTRPRSRRAVLLAGRAIEAADTDTLRRRFLGDPPPLTHALLAHLTQLNYRRRFALVAIDPATGHGVAIVGPGTAEIAAAVTPGLAAGRPGHRAHRAAGPGRV